MKKIFILFFFSFVLIQNTFAEDSNKLRVGVILALTGDAAGLGQALKNGINLGLEEIKKETKDKIDLRFEDDGLAAKNTIAAFNKMDASGGLDVVLTFSSGVSKPLAPITEQRKVTLLAIASDINIVKGRDYAFNFWMTPEEANKVLIAEAKKRGYKKIARINAIHDGIAYYKNNFDLQNQDEFSLVLDEEYNPDVRDFKPFLTKLKAKKDFDAIIVALLPGQIGLFAKQTRQFGIKKDLVGIELFEDPNEVKASSGALVGQWYVNNDEPEGTFPKLYASRFPEASTYASANGHDFVLLLAKAIESGYDGKNINQFFKTLKDFKGALGTFSASGDQRFTLPATIKVVTKDGFEKLNK